MGGDDSFRFHPDSNLPFLTEKVVELPFQRLMGETNYLDPWLSDSAWDIATEMALIIFVDDPWQTQNEILSLISQWLLIPLITASF